MEILFLLATIIVLIFSILLLVAPQSLLKLNEFFNRVVAIDSTIVSRRFIFGAIILICGIYMAYIYMKL